ncbi:MAG TPA: ThuA domain-containing protein [Streptosporangiaceae bacterium]|nr:ThuA domain-containing protein [Streptosporangiaceae bacterium]
MFRKWAVSALAGLLLAGSVAAAASAAASVRAADSGQAFRVLVFSKTAAFRHASIPAAIAAVEKLGSEHNFAVNATEDDTAFNDANLSHYQAVIFLMTTGDVLNDTEQAAFQRYIEHGGGYVGVHSASDTEYGWAWYGGLVGAYFRDHPSIQTATVDVAGKSTAATAPLPSKWVRTDEWYNFRTNPRKNVRVLATVDEKTYNPVGYTGGSMGADHPIAWCHPYDGGRAFYTAMGHTIQSYSEPLYLQHLLGGIEMAAGKAPFHCNPDD